jgi:hypothetical protein
LRVDFWYRQRRTTTYRNFAAASVSSRIVTPLSGAIYEFFRKCRLFQQSAQLALIKKTGKQLDSMCDVISTNLVNGLNLNKSPSDSMTVSRVELGFIAQS